MIVGGGPAGASAALSLLTYTNLHLMLIDHSDLCQQRIGEHVSSSIFSLLDYLELKREAFPEDCFLPAYGNISFWGQDMPINVHTINTPEGPTYQLDRESFDLKMIEEVADRGGQVFPRTRCARIQQREDNTWDIKLSHPEQGTYEVHARYLIDATGRNATICKQVGISSTQYDKLMGLGCFLKLADDQQVPHEQMIEATQDGWWYAAQLPNQMMTATFFTDADIISSQQLNRQAHWLDLLHKTRHLKHKLNGAPLVSKKPWVRNACSQITNTTKLANILAVGDAATSFDPISSMGIGSAMTSACHGARLVHADLMGLVNNEREIFQKDLEGNFKNYMDIRSKFYEAETRWNNALFWARRQKQEVLRQLTV